MRKLFAGTRAAGRAATKEPVFFIEAEFRTALVRFWSGAGKIIWRGQEWSGPTGARNASVLRMEEIVDAGTTEATKVKFTLSGVTPDLLGYCLDELSIAKTCKIWMGYVDAAGALVDEPAKAFKGYMDVSTVTEAAAGGTIELYVETDLRRLLQASNRRWTDADQQIDFPGDTGLRNISGAANWNGMWGSRQVAARGSGGGSGGGGSPRKMEED